MLAFVASAVLAATPAPPSIAAPGLNGFNVPAEGLAFFSEHVATRLANEGLKVMTRSQIAAVIGLEREKAMLGCTDESSDCLAELQDALGVDGVLMGQLAKLEDEYQFNLK